MKFIELKKHLSQGLDTAYLIEGEDRFVVQNALSQMEKRVGLMLPDVNRVVLDGGDKNMVEDLLFQLNSLPFGDEKKLIIVRDCSQKDGLKKVEEAVQNLPSYVVLVFVSYGENAFSKAIKKYVTLVDCSKLEPATIKSWILGQVKKAGKEIEEGALEKLVLYTNMNMARIETETAKLVSMAGEVITTNMVDTQVTRDREYQIYELADYLSKNDSEKVYDMVETLMTSATSGVGLVQYLYSAFRKLLLISLSTESDEELAKVFKVKPYAIKMSRIQAGKFSPKQLKRINEELSALEFDLKSGKANQENAVCIAVAKILLSK